MKIEETTKQAHTYLRPVQHMSHVPSIPLDGEDRERRRSKVAGTNTSEVREKAGKKRGVSLQTRKKEKVKRKRKERRRGRKKKGLGVCWK